MEISMQMMQLGQAAQQRIMKKTLYLPGLAARHPDQGIQLGVC